MIVKLGLKTIHDHLPSSPFIRVVSRIEGTVKHRCMVTLEDGDLYDPPNIRVGFTDYNGVFKFWGLDPSIRYRVVMRNLDGVFNSVIRERVMTVTQNEL
jgi:hypothetical protein